MSKADFLLVVGMLLFSIYAFQTLIWAVGAPWYVALSLSVVPIITAVLSAIIITQAVKS